MVDEHQLDCLFWFFLPPKYWQHVKMIKHVKILLRKHVKMIKPPISAQHSLDFDNKTVCFPDLTRHVRMFRNFSSEKSKWIYSNFGSVSLFSGANYLARGSSKKKRRSLYGTKRENHVFEHFFYYYSVFLYFWFGKINGKFLKLKRDDTGNFWNWNGKWKSWPNGKWKMTKREIKTEK